MSILNDIVGSAPTPKPFKNEVKIPIVANPKRMSEIAVPCKFKGVAFPTESIRTQNVQAVARHAFYGRDANYIEGTGRESAKVVVVAYFGNFVLPGKGEEWSYGNLFPTQYMKLVEAMRDNLPGDFVHPYLGTFSAVCTSWDEEQHPGDDGGVTVTITFEESISPEPDDNTPSTGSLDAAVQRFVYLSKPAVMPIDVDKDSLLDDLMGALTSAQQFIGSAQLAIQTKLGIINRVMGKLNGVRDAFIAADSNINSQVLGIINELKNKLTEAKTLVQSNAKLTIATHVTREETTSAELCSLLGNKVGDLLSLNGAVMCQAVIPENTEIRYYG